MKRFQVFLLVLYCLQLCACAAPAPAVQELYAMDTRMTLQIWGREQNSALEALTEYINTLDAQLSVTKPDSLIFQCNEIGSATLPAELPALFQEAAALSQRTSGALDITIYPLTRLWGFTTGSYRVPTQTEIEEAQALCGMEHLRITGNTLSLSPGAMIDLGAVAKGYAGEMAKELLARYDIDRAILSLGGNIQTYGAKPDGKPWQIAVQDPFAPGEVLGILSISGTAAAVTSGGYQRYFTENGKNYCHIIDPATGAPAESDLSSVTIVADSGLIADGLSTALYIMGLEKAFAFWRESTDFEAIFVTSTGEIYITQGLDGLFSNPKAQVIDR